MPLCDSNRLIPLDSEPIVLAVAAVPRLTAVADCGVVVEPHLDARGVRRDCHLKGLGGGPDAHAAVRHPLFCHDAPAEELASGVEDHPHVYVPDLRAVRTLPALRQA